MKTDGRESVHRLGPPPWLLGFLAVQELRAFAPSRVCGFPQIRPRMRWVRYFMRYGLPTSKANFRAMRPRPVAPAFSTSFSPLPLSTGTFTFLVRGGILEMARPVIRAPASHAPR